MGERYTALARSTFALPRVPLHPAHDSVPGIGAPGNQRQHALVTGAPQPHGLVVELDGGLDVASCSIVRSLKSLILSLPHLVSSRDDAV